jgi:hypothetical protein
MRLRIVIALLLLLIASGFSRQSSSRAVQGAAINHVFKPFFEWWMENRSRRAIRICKSTVEPERLAGERGNLLRCLKDVPEATALVADFYQRNELASRLSGLPSGLPFRARFVGGKACRSALHGFTVSQVGFSDAGDLGLVWVRMWDHGGGLYFVRRGANGWVVDRFCSIWVE